MKYYKIKAEHAGLRLDKYLTEKLGISRTQIQKSIKNSEILLNKKIAKVHAFLSSGDIISFRGPVADRSVVCSSVAGSNTTASHKPQTTPHKPTNPIVVLERPDFLIIEKPAGLLVQEENIKIEHATLVDWLVPRFPELTKIHDSMALERDDMTYRPGIVHRLDRDVSGLMIIPRTQEAFDYFKTLFKTKQIRKEYLALVVGRMKELFFSAEFPIGRSVSGKFAALPMNATNGKSAKTEIEKLEIKGGYTLVSALPFTGRTNQIRAHLSALGYPIVGDELYMSPKLWEKQKLKPGRIFLHAAKLSFDAPNGDFIEIESDLPEEMRAVIKKLK